ncbi:retrovirus-related Pol polyprotein from transposon 17.6 [Nephila pilipes]|uniref:RNA-directed DNA polymerase n=1 Tax=Nephila pilipes TaxID=299642 RepID=A0A8X6PL20_NEPPI|nr:retrovirus-related Pol polyprotein from transposon 17.6 [Nephila pilipes]
MVALRGEIAALSKQVERLSRDRSRNRFRGSKSEAEHKTHVRAVFQKLQHYGLTINTSKCVFGVSEISFLGHLVTQQGTKPLPNKVEPILNYPKPKTIKELQRFLGILNFFRRFLPNVAQHQIALSEFLKGTRKNDNRVIEWTTQAEQGFCTCKKLIADATLLAHPKPDAELILHVEASDLAIGGALFQIIDNEPQPLTFFSRKFSQTEKNYSAYDRELLASYASIKHFIHMLEARDFKLFTDHKPLTHAIKQRLDKCSPRQARQLDFISQFTTNICYLPGNENVTVDSLSRIASIEMPNHINYDEIAKSQESDLELQNLINNPQRLQLKKIVMPNSNIPLFCDLSTGTARPYIPKEYRQRIFSQLHNMSHPAGVLQRSLLRQIQFHTYFKNETLLHKWISKMFNVME